MAVARWNSGLDPAAAIEVDRLGEQQLNGIQRKVRCGLDAQDLHPGAITLLQERMVQMLALNEEHVWLLLLLVRPQIAEHLLPVAETGHAIFPRFADQGILLQNDPAKQQEAAPIRLRLVHVEEIELCVHAEVKVGMAAESVAIGSAIGVHLECLPESAVRNFSVAFAPEGGSIGTSLILLRFLLKAVPYIYPNECAL